jgi:Na+/H+-translocating membrane pyrophosphatase
VAVGLWAGLVIGFITQYYTSNAYRYLESFLASEYDGSIPLNACNV